MFVVVTLLHCSDLTRKETTSQLALKDLSGYMTTLYQSSAVRNAEVKLKGQTLELEYTFISDSNGMVMLDRIKADEYFITAIRPMSETEMETITGSPVSKVKLKNQNLGLITISCEHDTTITLSMEAVAGWSPLVISEIYASGAPNAGYYFHDKYVEIFNQTDSVIYLDRLILAQVDVAPSSGDTLNYIYSKNVWYFPGSGRDHPLEPAGFAICALDAIDHTLAGAPASVDLSNVRFEFFKEDTGKDVDNPNIPNMVMLYQSSGYDWMIGGEKDAVILSNADPLTLPFQNSLYPIPISSVIDGVEFLKDVTQTQLKKLSTQIDAGATGGIAFYTGKSMERMAFFLDGRMVMKDDNNSSLDFIVIDRPTPETHY